MEQNMSQEAEEGRQQNGHNVSIALIQKDIQYMRETMTKIETSITLFDRNFIRKDEVATLNREAQETHKQLFKLIEDVKNTIEGTSKIALDTSTIYGKDKASFWTAIKIISITYATILALASMVLWYKMHEIAENVVEEAFSNYEYDVTE